MTTSTETRGTQPRVAAVITELSSPAYLTMLTPPLVGFHTGGVTGLAWGGMTALFTGLIPLIFVLWGVRTGRLGHRRVQDRTQRFVPLLFAVASVVIGLAVLLLSTAPQDLVALVAAMLVGLAVTLAVTLAWKVSLHTSVAAGTVTVLSLTYGGAAAIIGWPIVVAVGWARVTQREHTPAQAAAGALVGALVAAITYSLLR